VIPLRDNLPTSRTPIVTIALIAANVLAYFLWQRGGLHLGSPPASDAHYQENLIRYASIPFEITHPGKQCVPSQTGAFVCSTAFGHRFDLPPTWLTVLTSMFMHGGLLHLGGNMLFLWIFGNNVEDSMGRVKFLIFYLLAGLAATALQVIVGPDSRVPNLGASGAIAGVLAGYLVLFPRARVATVVFIVFFFTIIELPAMIFLVIWFAQQALFGYFDLTDPRGGGGGVAYFAHIGGFVFGLLAVKLVADQARAQRQRWMVGR
jgi:membrane associated rhomboid family serine protease